MTMKKEEVLAESTKEAVWQSELIKSINEILFKKINPLFLESAASKKMKEALFVLQHIQIYNSWYEENISLGKQILKRLEDGESVQQLVQDLHINLEQLTCLLLFYEKEISEEEKQQRVSFLPKNSIYFFLAKEKVKNNYTMKQLVEEHEITEAEKLIIYAVASHPDIKLLHEKCVQKKRIQDGGDYYRLLQEGKSLMQINTLLCYVDIHSVGIKDDTMVKRMIDYLLTLPPNEKEEGFDLIAQNCSTPFLKIVNSICLSHLEPAQYRKVNHVTQITYEAAVQFIDNCPFLQKRRENNRLAWQAEKGEKPKRCNFRLRNCGYRIPREY